ncbi:hypothetical protein CRE_16792 [Caenorhabditis remanei]|uniref:Uncharacterized protein n=1 Tax=Caenorhabditis remanei TaxID=31234 RepID=E3MB52_CAERE|nr:hypothetical protein CRE_16792 [Caenorhabditis remanei]
MRTTNTDRSQSEEKSSREPRLLGALVRWVGTSFRSRKVNVSANNKMAMLKLSSHINKTHPSTPEESMLAFHGTCETAFTPSQKELDAIRWKKATADEIKAYILELTEHDHVTNYEKGYGESHRKLMKFVAMMFTPELVAAILEKIPINHLVIMNNPSKECFAIATLQALIACPPFCDYVKTKVPVTPIDHEIRSILAQYAVCWPLIQCSHLLDLVMNYERTVEEDAEDFYRLLEDNYFDDSFPMPTEEKTFHCYNCRETQIIVDKKTRISLPPILYDETTATMGGLMTYKLQGHEKVEKTCQKCGESEGCFITKCIFGDMFFISASITHHYADGRIADFDPCVDLGNLEKTKKSSEWRLAGVVHHERIDKHSAHYVAVIDRHNNDYLMNDSSCSKISCMSEIIRKHGKPYFAIYYRSTWKERPKVETSSSTSN